MKKLLFTFLLAAVPGTLCTLHAVVWQNPPNPLVLPTPDGGSLEFVPVYLNVRNSLLGTVEFTSGSPGTTPEETPTISTVGGSFRDGNSPDADWFYYLGTTEITRKVFNSVLRAAGLPEKQFPPGDEELPATGVSWFDVQMFLRAYNSWLRSDGKLPENLAGLPVFLRLPTEAEWEFAARGGGKIPRSEFDRRTPYGDQDVTLFEWVAGPTSSHNKINPVRRLQPHPLGLYDLLGNAAEMTFSVFQIEPGQGPVGGIAQRGGTCRTPANELRSSLRGEFPLFDEEGAENSSPWVGFRLVLGSIVYSDTERVEEIREGWDAYRETRAVPRPGWDRMTPAAETIARQTAEAERLLKTTKAQDTEALQRLREQLLDITAEKNRNEAQLLATLVRWCSQNAHIFAKNSALLSKISPESLTEALNARLSLLRENPTLADDQLATATLDALENTLRKFGYDRAAQLKAERESAQQVYLEALPLLADLPQDKVREEFDRYIIRLATEPEAKTQVATTRAAYNQLLEYTRTRQIAIDRWRLELAAAYSEADPSHTR